MLERDLPVGGVSVCLSVRPSHVAGSCDFQHRVGLAQLRYFFEANLHMPGPRLQIETKVGINGEDA